VPLPLTLCGRRRAFFFEEDSDEACGAPHSRETELSRFEVSDAREREEEVR
jgi:hypothetical protein